LYKGKYRIVISHHAFKRALKRHIHPDLIETTLQTGKMKKFRKNRVRFEKKFRKAEISCVDEMIGNTIKIVTITKKVRK